MNQIIVNRLFSAFFMLTVTVGGLSVSADEPANWDGKLVQFGKMHEAIGQQHHQGRVELSKLLERPRFFGVAALENLDGEATIYDGKVTVTRVDAQGKLEASDPPRLDAQATLLIGAYVPAWTDHKVAENVGSDELDQYLADTATAAGIKASVPFIFTIEGEFSDLRLHVINGACPMHARLKKIEIPKDKRPAIVELDKVNGTLVGIFAKDAVGNITHPATSTHMHLVFKDATSGKVVTGHVEQIGLKKGAIVRLPK